MQVIGGKDSPGWNQFVELCCDAFNKMRKHGIIFITLFTLVNNNTSFDIITFFLTLMLFFR